MTVFRRLRKTGRTVVAGVLTLILVPGIPAAFSQSSSLPSLNLQKLDQLFTAPAPSSQVVTTRVSLDGQELFTIAAPNIARSDNPAASTPIQQREHTIETTLQRFVDQGFDPNKLRVSSNLDANSSQPVISINGQYLMTVTTLDAQVHGQDPDRWSQDLTQIIRQGLLEAHAERQPSALFRQGAIAAGLTLAVLLISWGISRFQRRLRLRQQEIMASLAARPVLETEDPDPVETTAHEVQRQLQQRQHRELYDVQRRLLQLSQAGLWLGGAYSVVGLFPYTRWLQPLVVSGPLRLLGFGLGIYLLVRLSHVLIDRFFLVLEEGEFISPEASQRVTLRFSTFSRVLKSIVALLWIGAGLVTALSMIGVELGPVLAGAGIIGLAISFASQSLIKDMINGFLILLEDQYAVGDVIAIGNISGLVESMNLRITQLRNSEGRLITIPNGTITAVENLSKDWARVDLAVDIAYNADLDRALQVFQQVSEAMDHDPEWQELILEPPEVLGVDKLDQAGVTIRVWIKTQPLQQWKVAREFRRRLKLTLDQHGIEMGIPQRTLWVNRPPELIPPLQDDRDGKSLPQFRER